jgi:glycosyltransferase involved in cell wall biosynthesis
MKWLILIPTYNTGAALLKKTVTQALAQCADTWVVVDGSNDGSPATLHELQTQHPLLRVLTLPKNQGKGSALLYGVQEAKDAGFTHVLTMDADGQHPAEQVPTFLKKVEQYPEAVILGVPQFGAEAPNIRVQGRKISNALVSLQTLGWGVGDCLFGMRMYPVQVLLKGFASTAFARRFDFDAEIAVRLAWQGVPMLKLPTPVCYLSKEDGGISQFRYGRDNLLLAWMHTRLLLGTLLRLPLLLSRGPNPLRTCK